MPDTRFSWAVIMDLLDFLEHAGYKRGDDIHTGRAIALLWDAAWTTRASSTSRRRSPLSGWWSGASEGRGGACRCRDSAGEPAAMQQLAEIRLVLDAFAGKPTTGSTRSSRSTAS